MQTDVNREPAAPEIMSGAETLQSFISFCRRQFPVILFSFLLVTALGVIYIMTAQPSFTAQALLMIDARKVQVFEQHSILGDIPIDTASVESQVEVLKSENVALPIIKNLHLTEDPEFVGSGGGLLGAIFGLIFSPFETDQVASDFDLTRRAVRAFQDRLSIKRVGLSYIIQINFRSFDPERAAQIANAVSDSYIVDQLEAKYQATRRASVWLQDRIKELREQASTAERAVVEFKTKNNIITTGGPDGRVRLMGEQQVAELNSQLVIARAQTAESRARLDRIEQVLRANSPTATVDATVADTLRNEVVTKLRSHYLELAARESDWSARYGHDHLAAINLRNQMREIRNSIFDELKRLGETYKSDYEIAKQREDGIQKELTQAVAQSQVTNQAQVALRELESSYKTYQTLYDNFLQRYMESVQQQSFPITEARLISEASRPLGKSHPRTFLVFAITGFGGMILGFGIGMLRDLSDRVFRTGEQVQSLLQTGCIALVPMVKGIETVELPRDHKIDPDRPDAGRNTRELGVPSPSIASFSGLAQATHSINPLTSGNDVGKSNKGSGLKLSLPIEGKPTATASRDSKRNGGFAGPRIITRDENILWTVVDEPFSRFAEAIRSIKLTADLNGVVKSNKVIGFTSSIPNEGKSTVAAALAQLMSQAGARTILVDCDLRNPSLSKALAPRASAGILEVVSGKASLEETVWRDESTNMMFLPAAVKSHIAHSSEILSSDATKKLFDQLRQSYDYVVADFSPLAPIIDVRATTHLVDSYVFVIEWGSTKIDVVEHALSGAQGVYENLLGVVLNKVDMNVFVRYEGHRQNYYYNQHYARYGYME